MTRRALTLAVFSLSIALHGAAAAKSPPTDYHDPVPDPPVAADHSTPGQIAPPPMPPAITGPGLYSQIPSIDDSRLVDWSVRKQPYWTFGKIDPVLTEACQLGDFQSLTLNRIRLRFAGDKGRAVFLVVPPPLRHLLVDRRHLAAAGVTYFFFSSGQPDCEVRVDQTVPLQSFRPGRTTGLPPTDPKALQKRRAQIKAWPK